MCKKALLAVAIAAIALPGHVAMAASDASVTVQNLAFSPSSVTVTLDEDNGNHIRFTNKDFIPHQMTSDPHGNAVLEGACFTTPVLGNLQSANATITFTAQCLAASVVGGGATGSPITIPYHCHIHPGMRGTVVLQP